MTDTTKEKYSSTFTIDNFSSTTKLADHEFKIPIGSVETITEKEYNPYEHRKIEHPNTFFGALAHLLKSSLGTGILAIPFAFKSAGLIVGVFGTILTGVLCTHTIQLLVVASQEICKKSKTPMLGFSETAEAVFKYGPKPLRSWATFAKNFVDVALILTYYVGNAVYIVFISESVKQLVEYYHPETHEWTKLWYMLAILVPLILCCQVRQLKHLVPFSLIANSTMIIAFLITLYYMFSGISQVDISDRKLFTTIKNLPLFFSTVIFAMEGIGTMMPIENSLVKPQFVGCPGILNTAMTSVVILYTCMGFFGYLRFGDGVHASITFDLPESELAAQIAKACISIAVFFTFMLQFYVPMDITWRRVAPRIKEEYHNIAQVLLRIGLVIFIVGIAAAVPNLGPIIGLVGSLFFSTLGLFIPAVIDIVLNWDGDFGTFKWVLWKDVCIIILSFFAMVSGSFYAIKEMYEN